MRSPFKLAICAGLACVNATAALSSGTKTLFISSLSPKLITNPRDLSCNIFFGSTAFTYDDEEYKRQAVLHEHFKKVDDDTDTSGLPLAPENEDDPIEDVEDEHDLTRPPTSKEEWNLKRIAHGRRFWHKFFAQPSEKTMKALRWAKYRHDKGHCNRVLEREYTQVPKIESKKGPDGKLMKLTAKQRRFNRHSLRVKRKIVGYDNSSNDSNMLIIANSSQERLVNLVEKLRMPGVLDLRNYELLRLLRKTLLFLARPNIFRNAARLLLSFGRLNTEFEGEFRTFAEIPEKPKKRFRPQVYAIIGKLRNDPFEKDLLLPRKARAPPIRAPYPAFNEPTSLVNRFLDSCKTLAWHKKKTTPYNYDETMDRSFSDAFDRSPDYTTKQSVNKIDCPALVNYEEEMAEYLRPAEARENPDFTGWTAADVRNMLKRAPKLGLTRAETLIKRLKSLHTDVGLSYEDIIRIGKTHPQVLRYGNYKLRCLQIYDIDEGFTHEMVNRLVRAFPNLLTYNIDRCIKPKVFYLTRNIGKSLEDLLEFPKYLSFSLYDRIIPRHFAVMNKHYDGEFLSVYNFLFQTGFYRSYGQPIMHPKFPNPLPDNHAEYLASYLELSRAVDLRELLCTGDDKFCELFGISYRRLVEARLKAFKIPLPANIV